MTSPIETNNVVERLKKRKRVLYDDDTLRYAFELINPDGPDAVKFIQSLSDRIDVLREALRRLVENHGDHIFDLPGQTGVSDLERARAALHQEGISAD